MLSSVWQRILISAACFVCDSQWSCRVKVHGYNWQWLGKPEASCIPRFSVSKTDLVTRLAPIDYTTFPTHILFAWGKEVASSATFDLGLHSFVQHAQVLQTVQVAHDVLPAAHSENSSKVTLRNKRRFLNILGDRSMVHCIYTLHIPCSMYRFFSLIYVW